VSFLQITAFTTAAYFVARGAKSAAGTKHGSKLLLILAARTFLTRKTSKPPRWMGNSLVSG
jgi:hypothetical protein